MHKDNIKSCYLGIGNQAIIQDFGSTTEQLRALCEDIRGHGINDVIIESTGIYWVPLYDMLTSQHINVIIANPLRVKQIPGKKTDTAASEWLCKSLMNGLVVVVSFQRLPCGN